MKKVARIICLMLIIAITLSCTIHASIDKQFVYFEDIDRTQWYYNDVIEMAQCDYIQGIGHLRFSPNAPMTRAMFVTILGRVLNVEVSAYKNKNFSDVEKGTWYEPYVAWAYECRITSGITPTKFCPNQPVTREQMASFVERSVYIFYLSLLDGKNITGKFVDIAKVSPWAQTSVELMRKTGILQGDNYGRFQPKAYATRAQAAAIFNRYLQAAGLEKDSDLFHFPDTPLIVHAAGKVGNEIGGNTMEGLINSYNSGLRMIELDLNFTSDGYLVCIHDWDSRFSSDITTGQPLTLSKFKKCKIYGKYTPMHISDVTTFLKKHKDAYIVTDVKDDNLRAVRVLRDVYPDMKDRFIIQVYNEQEYDSVWEYGFRNIIFSLYKMDWNEKIDATHLVEFSAHHSLIAFAFSTDLCDRDGYVNEMRKAGVPLFVHTVNSASKRKKYYRMGIYGVYSDYLS